MSPRKFYVHRAISVLDWFQPIVTHLRMSHQRSTLQSRPYNYAILARSQNDRTRHCQDCASSIANDDNEPSHSRGIPVRPVTSMADTSEHTPLIGHSPPIPRIHQITDDDICSEQYSECIPSAQMFYEELNVLTRYSLPVFVYAQKYLISTESLFIFLAHISPSSVSSLRPSFALGTCPRLPSLLGHLA